MVGVACSSDESFDYNYILVKAYDLIDPAFTDGAEPSEVYRVNRKIQSSELLFTNKKDGTRYMSLSQILYIADRVISEEYKRDYPVIISWSVNASGLCEVKSVSDMDSVWPVTPYCIERNIKYINITDFFFDKKPSGLYMSFVEDVINKALYFCGLYSGAFIKIIGDALFCSSEFAYFLSLYFGIHEFWNISCKISEEEFVIPCSEDIISNINSTCLIREHINAFNSQNLCRLEVQSIAETMELIKNCLGNPQLSDIFICEIKLIFENAFKRISLQKDDFVFYSGGMEISDMKYLTFDELMGVYAFGEHKKEYADIIKINRQRSRILNNLKAPRAIYKCNLIFDL